METSALWRAPAATLRRWIGAGEVSSEALIRATLERIAALDGATNAFATVDSEGALLAAREADRERARGGPLGPLHGLPVSIKDVIPTRGLRTTYGSRLFAAHVPNTEPEAVARVRRAGGIVIGKTTTPEFAHKALTDSPLLGITRNPWSLAHSSGGSSGGAGVAAAMGFCALNVCTDGAGSSRIPAACCGVVGLKPTMGRVPNDAAVDLFGLQVIGVIGRTVGDAALLFDVLQGPHADDPLSQCGPAFGEEAPSDAALRGLRVRWLPRIGNDRVDSQVCAASIALLETMQSAGASVEEGATIDWSLDAWRTLLRAQQAQRFGRLPDASRAMLDPGMRQCIDEGLAQSAADLQHAIVERSALFRRVQSLLAGADVLVSPVVASAALTATHASHEPVVIEGIEAGTLRNAWYSYAIPLNASGHPALSVPCGMTREGLPIGLQLIAPWHAEHRLLRIAAAIERLQPWSDRWPAIATGTPLTPHQRNARPRADPLETP